MRFVLLALLAPLLPVAVHVMDEAPDRHEGAYRLGVDAVRASRVDLDVRQSNCVVITSWGYTEVLVGHARATWTPPPDERVHVPLALAFHGPDKNITRVSGKSPLELPIRNFTLAPGVEATLRVGLAPRATGAAVRQAVDVVYALEYEGAPVKSKASGC